MIDFGLSEMMLVGVVALIVLGPERLPGVARMAGSVFGRAQRYVHQLRNEVNRELELDDLHQLRNEVQDAANEIENKLSRRTFFSNSDSESETQNLSQELAASKAKVFRSRKTEIRSIVVRRAVKVQPVRRKLTSTAARAARNKTSTSQRQGAR